MRLIDADALWMDVIHSMDYCDDILEFIERQPTIEPTLYGYNIEHLDLIARALQKENLPPERVTEALMDIGRIANIICDEFAESLRKSMK